MNLAIIAKLERRVVALDAAFAVFGFTRVDTCPNTVCIGGTVAKFAHALVHVVDFVAKDLQSQSAHLGNAVDVLILSDLDVRDACCSGGARGAVEDGARLLYKLDAFELSIGFLYDLGQCMEVRCSIPGRAFARAGHRHLVSGKG